MNNEEYKKLLSTIIKKGFAFKKFEDFVENKNGQLILRHDIDFSIEYAVEMSEIEKFFGVKSTYFFLISCENYNLLSKKNVESVKTIMNVGHSVGLHFDPTSYDNELEGLKYELEIFQNYFGQTKLLSFHRPSNKILQGVNWIPNDIINSYSKKYYNDITYISDSGGEFSFGHPFENSSFLSLKNIQLLIHPIWWMTESEKITDKIKEFMINNSEKISKNISNNCKPWKKYLD